MVFFPIVRLSAILLVVVALPSASEPASAGIHSIGQEADAPMLRPLSQVELRSLLKNVIVTTLHPDLYDGDSVERFRADGTYIRYGDRARRYGRFIIRGSMVWVRVESENGELCRGVFADRDGLLFTMATGAGNDRPARISIRSESGIVTAPMNESASRPVEGDALRALLRDVFVARPRLSDGVITSPSGEVFRYNGVYESIDGRRRLEGVYSIDGNAVCVHGQGFVRQCRRVLALPGGVYAFVDTEDGSSTTMTVSPLE